MVPPDGQEERGTLSIALFALLCGEKAEIGGAYYGDRKVELMGGQIFLATKFAAIDSPDGKREIRNDPEYIRGAIDKSLKRLGTDYVDLWYW